MRGGWFGSRLVWMLWVGTGGACANIIGLSDYEIVSESGGEAGEPNLNEGGQPGAGGAASAGSENVGGEPQGAGGGPLGMGGEPQGMAGDAAGGMAGSPPVGCTEASCDDDIECTVDACRDGECVHTPDTSLCDRDANECIVCKVGLGCVPGTTSIEQLLINPGFDELIGAEWEEDVQDSLQTAILFQDEYADSPPNSAWYLGVEDPETATVQGYADLLQSISVPDNIVGLKLSGVYELITGTYLPADDYIVAGIYEGNSKLVEFNRWNGDDTQFTSWAPFEGSATAVELTRIAGKDLTFDIVGETWDTAFYFDTLSLEATLCEDGEE